MPEVNWDPSDTSINRDQDGCKDSTEDTDDDADGIDDFADLCDDIGDKMGWTSNSVRDHDADGCHDTEEDDDDDNDAVPDTDDSCPRGWFNWSTSPSTDHDTDGCADEGEDDDDDNDLALDEALFYAAGHAPLLEESLGGEGKVYWQLFWDSKEAADAAWASGPSEEFAAWAEKHQSVLTCDGENRRGYDAYFPNADNDNWGEPSVQWVTYGHYCKFNDEDGLEKLSNPWKKHDNLPL